MLASASNGFGDRIQVTFQGGFQQGALIGEVLFLPPKAKLRGSKLRVCVKTIRIDRSLWSRLGNVVILLGGAVTKGSG